MLVFSKSNVLELIKEAGNEDKITKEILDQLDNFDGSEAVKSDWDALVYDKELYIITGKNGDKIKVSREELIEQV